VGATSAGSPGRPLYLNNLANALVSRSGQDDSRADLDQAVVTWERGVAEIPPDSPFLPLLLTNLGAGLGERSRRTGSAGDLDRAVRLQQQAVTLAPAGAPGRPSRLNNLASSLARRSLRSHDPADLRAATESYDRAARDGLEVAVQSALLSARSWGDWAFERQEWSEAARAYGLAGEAVERLWRVQPLRRDQEAALRPSQGLPARTAYALVNVGELAEAVRALEAGPARVLTAARERGRADLEGLRQSRPALHEDYVRTAGRVALLEAGPLPPGDLDPAAEARAARAALEAAVRAIRGVQGHETFLRPPTLEDVR